MRALRERLEPHFMGLIICGGSGLAAGFPLFYVAKAWSSPGLLIVSVIALVAMLVGFAVAPREPAVAEPERQPGDDKIGRMSDDEFDDLLAEVERGARAPDPAPAVVATEDPFELLVRDALDELPAFVQEDLRSGNLVVVASNGGDEWNAFGLYMGGDVADDRWHRRILIFRDTLTRAYGNDPEELHRQVAITVRHEVAHFYGADEQKVRALGL